MAGFRGLEGWGQRPYSDVSSSPALGQSGPAQPAQQAVQGPSRAIKVKKWPERAKIQANPGQQPASNPISTFACFEQKGSEHGNRQDHHTIQPVVIKSNL
jgi:hypothetical protein